MFRINIDVKDNTNAEKFVSELKKHKEISKITLPKKKKALRKMTDYYTIEGKQLSQVEFRNRIKESEESMKNGGGYSTDEVLKSIKGWRKNSKR